jgi:uroporphyrinogen-III synthase
MRVLVTRPEPDASRTAAALAARGHEALVTPVLVILPLPHVAIPARPYRAVLVTSGNALRALEAHPQHLHLQGLKLFAAGAHTAERARGLGFAPVYAAEGGVAALADLVTRTLAPDGRPLLYLAGIDRAGDLDGELSRAGYRVDLVELYRAEAVSRLDSAVSTALAAGEVDAALFASRRTAEIFAALIAGAGIESALARITAVAISANVAEALAPLGFRAVNIAEKPTEMAMIAALPSRA